MSEERAIKPKSGLLKFAKELGNVSRACKIMGYSRDSYYRFKEAFEVGGEEGLKDLNDKVIPFFDSEKIQLLRILTDRGTEYCGNREFQEYQLYLFTETIDHTKTRARSPQTNGICERFRKTILNEFYATAFRKKIYRSIEELQKDLDEWMVDYNYERTHQGKYCYGKTPYQTFLDSKKLADAKQIYSETVIEKQDVKVETRNSFADKNPSQQKGVFGSESNFVSSKGKSDQRLYAEK